MNPHIDRYLAPDPSPEALAVAPSPDKIQLKDMTRPELDEFLATLGEKKFRGEQIWNWMYVRLAASFDEMTNLSKGLRATLDEKCSLHRVAPGQMHPSPDGAVKCTFVCVDGAEVESVWIPNEDRNTLCVSSQVGCAIGCTFCQTAKMGLLRNLTVGEIVEQIVHIRRMFPAEKYGRLTNIVMMGMGEPLHNYDNVIKSLHVMTSEKGLGLSNRKVTVSTSGLVNRLETFGHDAKANLAVSLNATTNAVRDEIMPINRRWPIEVLLDTLKRFPLAARRRITFEYVLLGGLTDSLDDADRLAKLVRGIPAKINLIPWNPHPGGEFQRPAPGRVGEFVERLRKKDLNVTVRETRGLDTMAACGQLGKPGLRKRKKGKALAPPVQDLTGAAPVEETAP
jgi:23S rRNA (adenine2503-C2)-methyltransferase